MTIEHTKKFGIYHWDTFDDTTFLVDEADTLPQAQKKVTDKYGSSISDDGADRVDIVDKNGKIVKKYSIK